MSEGNGLLHDETGGRSTARVLLWLVVIVTLVLIAVDSSPREAIVVPGEAYVLLGTIVSGLILWAGGARIAQYAAPMFAQMAGGLAGAVRARNERRDADLGIEVTKG